MIVVKDLIVVAVVYSRSAHCRTCGRCSRPTYMITASNCSEFWERCQRYVEIKHDPLEVAQLLTCATSGEKTRLFIRHLVHQLTRVTHCRGKPPTKHRQRQVSTLGVGHLSDERRHAPGIKLINAARRWLGQHKMLLLVEKYTSRQRPEICVESGEYVCVCVPPSLSRAPPVPPFAGLRGSLMWRGRHCSV